MSPEETHILQALDTVSRFLQGEIAASRTEAREAHRELGEKLDQHGRRIGVLEREQAREEGAEQERTDHRRRIGAVVAMVGVGATVAGVIAGVVVEVLSRT